ncbi:MAG TPA: hypothetical protein PLQ80_03385, partial [Candidatus Syntrophosphaera sp.]|nr:hypothetical protein [Candidatus Syntrophosphaera sp.]
RKNAETGKTGSEKSRGMGTTWEWAAEKRGNRENGIRKKQGNGNDVGIGHGKTRKQGKRVQKKEEEWE